MEQMYKEKMNRLGYNQLVCDIFANWENVKDEILLPERKTGSGNGTIHIFLGAADDELRQEFSSYYSAVEKGEDPATSAVKITHYFLPSNVISMLGHVCQYCYSKNQNIEKHAKEILDELSKMPMENEMISSSSFFKLSLGSNKLRPYFKQFDADGAFTKIIRKTLLPKSSYKISLYKNSENKYAAFWLLGFETLSNFEADSSSLHLEEASKNESISKHFPLQQIFYGAPGTGKSHTIKKTTDGVDSKFVVRTTFHPDSDYSTFVGAYKPKMEVMPRYNPQTGEQMGVEKRIVYAYTPQAFLKAYITAWQNPEQPVYLIIEEINRGNCAQIFGDLFQLLDRGDDGQSCYPIKADQDMQMHLMEVFAGYDALPENIRLGEELVLPSNLYIWATMNTSDQSLFPIDSAFKRRWEWKYIPITQGKDKESGKLMQWSIEAEGVRYDWWSFLEVMNKRVGDITSSEDKKLGFFFCKADGQGVISADKFVSKVMFYLWNDVFKDYPDNPIAMYLKEEGGEFTYGDFYTTDSSGEVVVREELVTKLLEALGVKKVESRE